MSRMHRGMENVDFLSPFLETKYKTECQTDSICFPCVFFFQVLGNWSPVFLSGDSAHPLWEHPRTGPQAATILSELCGDHAQRSRRGEDWDPRVSTPISREEVELHNCQ